MWNMDGQVVIVTGASRGIGLQLAGRFLEAGAFVSTCSRSELSDPPAASGADPSLRERTFHRACDQRNADQIEAFASETRSRFGRIDVLINNAGGSPLRETAEASAEFHSSIIENNLLGPLLFSTAVYRHMKEQEAGGSIINISSMASSVSGAPPGLVSYGAAKAGLNQLTHSLAREWAPRVRVNCLVLGLIETENLRKEAMPTEEARRRLVGTIPAGRVGQPDEVAEACLYLCSPQAAYVTGAQIAIDGGGIG